MAEALRKTLILNDELSSPEEVQQPVALLTVDWELVRLDYQLVI